MNELTTNSKSKRARGNSQFISFVKKEFRHIFRDKRTLLILLWIPILEILLFGFAIKTEVLNINVAVLNPANDEMATEIIRRMAANRYFKITGILNHAQEVEKVLNYGVADLVVIFESNFSSKVIRGEQPSVQVIADATDPNTAITEIGYASNIIKETHRNRQDVQAEKVNIIPNYQMLYNPQMESAYNFVPGVMGLIMMLICAMMTSISIVREKEMGTMELLLVSPVKPIHIILSKAVPYLFISCGNLLNILVLSVFVLNIPVAGSLFWLVFISIIYLIVCLSLGLLISSVAGTQVAAMLISGTMLMVPTVMLSGMIYPVDNMPRILEMLSNIIPAKWYILSVKKLMIQGLGVKYVLKEMIILIVMATAMIGVSLKKFNTRLR